jgi:hypothetical protein
MRLKRRDIAIIQAGAAVLGLLLFYLFLVSPALSRRESLERSIAAKEKDLREMTALRARWEEFERLQGEAEKLLAGRGDNFTLLSFLEGVSRKVGIQDKIQYMKPLGSLEETGGMSLVGMEINLEGIGVDQVVAFLYEIEFSGMLLGIKRIKVQTLQRGQEQALRVTLQVDTVTAV